MLGLRLAQLSWQLHRYLPIGLRNGAKVLRIFGTALPLTEGLCLCPLFWQPGFLVSWFQRGYLALVAIALSFSCCRICTESLSSSQMLYRYQKPSHHTRQRRRLAVCL